MTDVDLSGLTAEVAVGSSAPDAHLSSVVEEVALNLPAPDAHLSNLVLEVAVKYAPPPLLVVPKLGYYDLDVDIAYETYRGPSAFRILINGDVRDEISGAGRVMPWRRFPLSVLDAGDVISLELIADDDPTAVAVIEASLYLVQPVTRAQQVLVFLPAYGYVDEHTVVLDEEIGYAYESSIEFDYGYVTESTVSSDGSHYITESTVSSDGAGYTDENTL